MIGRAGLMRIFGMLLLAGLMALSACATQPEVRRPARPAPTSRPPRESPPPPAPEPSLPPGSTAPAPSPKSPEPAPAPSPRLAASRHLTEQARVLLENGKPDEAIRTLERAVNLSPTNGLNFYYLSEAWMMKNDLRQAEEFNMLAALYFKDDPVWAARVSQQAERIRKRRGQ
ncbi:MAG: tetratricopeptide repeat protein [Thermodesulfobacteriota bacterium]